MKQIDMFKNKIQKYYNDNIKLEEKIKKNNKLLDKLNNDLLETCILQGTHKYVRVYDCLSYGETEYKCETCGLYR